MAPNWAKLGVKWRQNGSTVKPERKEMSTPKAYIPNYKDVENIQKRRDNYDLLTLGTITEELAFIKMFRTFLEEELIGALKGNVKMLEAKALDMMEEQGVEKYDVKDIGKIKMTNNIRGDIESPVEFFKYLVEHKETGLAMLQISPDIIPKKLQKQLMGLDPKNPMDPADLKLGIAWNTLSGYLDAKCDVMDKKTWPPGVNVRHWTGLKLTLNKAKKGKD